MSSSAAAFEDHYELIAPFKGYHKKALAARQDVLSSRHPALSDSMDVLDDGGLPSRVADLMVENCIGKLALPMGVAPNFVVNGRQYIVPMCTEEPSVIAAASNAAKLVATCGGFHGVSTRNLMTAQVQLLDVKDARKAVSLIHANRAKLMDAARQFCLSMEKRGGGVVDLSARVVRPRATPGRAARHQRPYVVVHIQVDVCEAMGANKINGVAEGVAPELARLVGGRPGLRILTNLCVERRSIVSFRIPVSKLAWKGVSGKDVADRILEAYYFAVDDPFRAATNNKGVMNGMDAVAIATGQDWRAVEAGAHTWCARRGHYEPLAHYELHDGVQGEEPVLVGRLEMPLSIGTRGGALQTHPSYRFTHRLLGDPSAQELAQLLVSVGLAQNFAAIRALAIEGINKGHMALHARTVAASAGVPDALVDEVTEHMIRTHAISKQAALDYLQHKANAPAATKEQPKLLSML